MLSTYKTKCMAPLDILNPIVLCNSRGRDQYVIKFYSLIIFMAQWCEMEWSRMHYNMAHVKLTTTKVSQLASVTLEERK